MKNWLAVAVISLSTAAPSLTQAQAPVLQQVVIRYILVDPGNADPARDGFEPIERVAVLMLFIGGDGTLGLTANQVNTARRISSRAIGTTSRRKALSSR